MEEAHKGLSIGRVFCLFCSKKFLVGVGSTQRLETGPSLGFPPDLDFWPEENKNGGWVPDMVREGLA